MTLGTTPVLSFNSPPKAAFVLGFSVVLWSIAAIIRSEARNDDRQVPPVGVPNKTAPLVVLRRPFLGSLKNSLTQLINQLNSR